MSGTAPAFAQIEEIVVTTRKRAENLQEVPIVVTAFTAELIQRKGITDLADIAKYTSGVMLDSGFSRQDTRVVIRGLSPTRGRQNVAILQDEVDISSLAQGSAGGSFIINPRLLDVERIEVVKGPHPALFGRSAFSGAINYISKKPGDTFQGNAQVDVGTDEKVEGRVSVSGPVVADKVSLGFNGSVWTFGGFYDSPITGKGLGGGEGYGGAFSFVVTPSDALKFTGRVEYSDDDFDPEPRIAKLPVEVALPSRAFTSAAGATAPVIAPTPASNLTFPQAFGSLGNASDYVLTGPSTNPRTGSDYPGAQRTIFRNTLRIDVETGFANFTSISHYGDNTQFQFQDGGLSGFRGDFRSPTTVATSELYFDTDIQLMSQELRVQNADRDAALQWTFGGLYWNEKLEQLTRGVSCVGPTGTTCGNILAGLFGFHTPPNTIKRNTHHYSVYGLAEYAITDALKAEVELRWTKELESTSGFTTSSTFVGCPGATPSRAANPDGTLRCAGTGPLVTALGPATGFTRVSVPSEFWTPRFTVDYKATDDALVYASVGMGKKPGGLSTLAGVANAATNIYEPEEMWVYELGAKTSWLDGRLTINGAAYFQDYGKKQVSVTLTTPTPPFTTTRVVNAAKAEVKGFEIDIAAAPTDFITLTASYTYNDGEYKEFTDISNSASGLSRAAIAQPTNACAQVILVGTGSRCVVDYSGNLLEGSPKHSLQLGSEFRGELGGDLEWFAGGDARFQTKRFTSFENSLVMESYWLVDLRAGVRTEGWSITGYVNNVFDDDTLKNSAVYIQDWVTSFAPPRPTAITSLASALLPDRRQFGVRASLDF